MVIYNLIQLARNCTKSTQPLADPTAQTDEWIGLIYLPAIEETIKEQGGSQRTRCSLLDQVSQSELTRVKLREPLRRKKAPIKANAALCWTRLMGQTRLTPVKFREPSRSK